MVEPVELPYSRCAELLRSEEVGRVAVCTPSGPRIVPVNYTVVQDAILFRTTPYSVLGTYAWNSQLAFEVDGLDRERRRGWSVVAIGRGAMVEDSTELAASGGNPVPWTAGQRPMLVQLRWENLTGRRIGPDWARGEAVSARRPVTG